MAVARDWLKTLWNASYKGTPFFVERDEEDGGRRIVKHQFPMRDDPYLEDLGEDLRQFSVSAYVASDSADGEASALAQTCATRGPGLVVLPTHGPILVRCENFRRDRSKDKHGYIAFRIEFIRDGAASALASIASLANTVFVQADSMALSAATAFASAIQMTGRPDYVQQAVIAGVQDNVAAIEVIRTTENVDTEVSSVQRTEIQSIFDAAPFVASNAVGIAGRIITAARAIGDAIPAEASAPAFEQAFESAQIVIPPPQYRTINTLAEASNRSATLQALRLAALIVYSEAVARIELRDRTAAITLRADVSEHFDSELLVTSASDIDLMHSLMKLRDAVVDYLSRSIIDLAPIVTVDANLTLPSLFWSWQLYQDPTRASELTARNKLAHPSFFPLSFEALAK